MNEKEAWNAFLITGSVQDYLNYKAVQNNSAHSTTETPKGSNENIHGRTDNQTTEYR